MFQFRKKILGLDIGHRSVKGVLLSRRGTEVVLEDYFYLDLRESFEDGSSDSDIAQLLKAVIDGRGLRSRFVAACIDDRDVQLVSLTLPPLAEDEFRSVVLNKLEAQLGKSIEDLSVDFCPIPTPDGVTKLAGAQQEVVAYYTKLETVQARMAMLQEADLQPFSLECSMLATLEAARFNDYIPKSEACLLVDVGDIHTTVGLVSCGELVQLNTIRAGAGDINEALIKQFTCSFQDSELRKIAYQLEKEENTQVDAETRVVEQGYFQIILGIHDTITYLKAARKSQSISSVVLTGGGLLKEGAASIIQQSLNLPVTVLDPLRKIQIFSGTNKEKAEELPRIGPMMQVAVGLALRGVA